MRQLAILFLMSSSVVTASAQQELAARPREVMQAVRAHDAVKVTSLLSNETPDDRSRLAALKAKLVRREADVKTSDLHVAAPQLGDVNATQDFRMKVSWINAVGRERETTLTFRARAQRVGAAWRLLPVKLLGEATTTGTFMHDEVAEIVPPPVVSKAVAAQQLLDHACELAHALDDHDVPAVDRLLIADSPRDRQFRQLLRDRLVRKEGNLHVADVQTGIVQMGATEGTVTFRLRLTWVTAVGREKSSVMEFQAKAQGAGDGWRMVGIRVLGETA